MGVYPDESPAEQGRPVASPALCELPQVQAIVEQLCDDKMKNVSVQRANNAHM